MLYILDAKTTSNTNKTHKSMRTMMNTDGLARYDNVILRSTLSCKVNMSGGNMCSAHKNRSSCHH